MQQKDVAEKFMKKFPFVNFVMGTHNMHQLPQIVLQVVKYGERVCAVWDSEGEIIEGDFRIQIRHSRIQIRHSQILTPIIH